MNVLFMIISLFIICQFTIGVDAQVTYVNKGCVGRLDNGTDPAVLVFQQIDLGILLGKLSSETSNVTFYKTSIVDPSYSVYGLFQCREDLSLDNCGRCIEDATMMITEVCPAYAEAIVWYQECMLRYANRSIFSTYETTPFAKDWNVSHVSNYDQFSPKFASAMNSLINYTASTPLHFAASENVLTSNQKLYSFAQCTPDIDTLGCNACLRKAFSQVTNCCRESTRLMIFLPSCQLRYDNRSFWSGNIPLAPPLTIIQAPIPSIKKPSSLKRAVVVAVASAITVGLVLLIAGVWICLYKKQRKQSSARIRVGAPERSPSVNMDDLKSLESLQFDFKDIKAATRNFSNYNKLGQGGFGEVFKGKLSNGEEIAVKRLSKHSEQGTLEFQNEVLLVANLQHRNLVKLLGFCISRKEQILIYEFLSNSSLDGFLYDPLKRASLEWEVRFRIISGVARGLLYLHEDSRLKIIHRDLKSSNILLDEDMNAKIADFGLAKLFDLDQTQGDTRRIAGTYGYMAPEYAMAGQFSVKSDVYSFGVIVLEIVSGQRHGFFNREQEEGLLRRAWRLWNEKATLELVDPLLGKNCSKEEVNLCVLIGLLCIQEDPTQRPRMTSVVAALNGQSVTLPLPNAPLFFTIDVVTDASTTSGNNNSLQTDQVERKPDQCEGTHTRTVSITELHPR